MLLCELISTAQGDVSETAMCSSKTIGYWDSQRRITLEAVYRGNVQSLGKMHGVVLDAGTVP